MKFMSLLSKTWSYHIYYTGTYNSFP